jgi:hypothetical protein
MTRLASTATTALLMGMSTFSSFAAESVPVSVNTPAISQSVTRSDLIARSSNAVRDFVLTHADAGARLSNLWVFPTADANTVFVRYTLGDSSAEHLLVVEMDGTRIAQLRDLTSEANPTEVIEAGL